jgi:hypothetical protein
MPYGGALAAPDHAVGGARSQADCYALAKPVARGGAIAPETIVPVACADRFAAPLSYDRAASLVVAGGDLEAGAYLGHVFVPGTPEVAKGATLTLVSRDGPVRIERVVTAMQSSRGGRVFVRDADGQIYSAAIAKAGAGQ